VAVSYEGMATHSGLIGVSTNKKRKSMFNHMTRFLAKYPYHRRESDGGFATTLDELPESAFDDKCTLMGKFSSYQFEYTNMKFFELGHHYERGIYTLDFQTAGRITEVRLTHTCLASYITHSFL
jgi:hypothetical protein